MNRVTECCVKPPAVPDAEPAEEPLLRAAELVCVQLCVVFKCLISQLKLDSPYFPDYKLSISRISQKMRHEEQKNIYKSHWTISRIH